MRKDNAYTWRISSVVLKRLKAKTKEDNTNIAEVLDGIIAEKYQNIFNENDENWKKYDEVENEL